MATVSGIGGAFYGHPLSLGTAEDNIGVFWLNLATETAAACSMGGYQGGA